MKKKLLSSIIESLKERKKSTEKYHVHAELIEVEGKALLLLLITDDGKFYCVFQSKDTFISYDFSDEKWRTSQLEGMLCYSFKTKYSISQNSEKVIFDYFESNHQDPISLVQECQKTIRADALKEKHDKIRACIDDKMKCIKPLPKGIVSWIDREAHSNSRYVFYKKKNGFCSVCKREVTVDGKHKDIGCCPKCKAKIEYRAIGYSKKVIDYCMFSYMQKSDTGVVIRIFSSEKDYSNDFKEPVITFVEVRRYFLKEDGLEPYYYGSFYGKERRWCEGFYSGGFYYREINDRGAVYTRNLKNVLKGTIHEHSGLLEYIKLQKDHIILDEYIYAYHYNKTLEKVVKSGLKRLSREIVFAPKRIELMKDSKWPTESLGINKKSYNLLRAVDGTSSTLNFLRTLEKSQLQITKEALSWLTNENILKRFSEVLDYTTITKGINYLKKAEDDKFSLRLDLWLDYLKIARKVKYDLSNSIRLFPRHLKKSHDEVMLLYTENKIAYCNQHIMDRFCKTEEQFSFSYKNLMIRVPTCRVDIIREGEKLLHCVRSKVEDVADNKTTILFIRRKETPDKSFYTVEVKNDRIIQCYGYDHAVSTDEVKFFLEKFEKSRLCNKKME